MELSYFKDIEQGFQNEEENEVPLMDKNCPTRLEFQHDECKYSPENQIKQNLLDQYHDSLPSTANSTPVTEAPVDLTKKWRRSDRRLRRLNTELLEAIEKQDNEEVERLLNAGANPNATCRLDLVSACHMAAMIGGEALDLLLKFGAEKNRQDKLGRTPLHLAAWAGNARQMAVLLDFPEDIHGLVENDNMISECEENVKKLCQKTKDLANIRSDLGEIMMPIPKIWKDNIDHNCQDIQGSLPALQPGWTPLHVASSRAHRHCTRLLLAAGADPNITDVIGRTSLDVVGFAYYYDKEIDPVNFTEVIKMLIKAGGQYKTMKANGIDHINTPLHTAVELENLAAINELLNADTSIACLNIDNRTPLHVCVAKQLEEPLQMLANYGKNHADPMCAMVDVKDGEGHTVLQAAVEAKWVSGVCIALEAGADVTMKANDGETPIHSAAALGNLDVLNEILSVAKIIDIIDCQNDSGETPLFKSIIYGHIECMKALLDEGASIEKTLPGEVNVLHIAADNGQTEVLKELLNYDETATQKMINALTENSKQGLGPLHAAIANNHIDCVELLLAKDADIRLRTSSSPHNSSTPLHIAAVKNRNEIAKIILSYDKTTIHEVNSRGWYPLHSASHHGSRDVINLLLREGADLSSYTDGPVKYRQTAIEMILNNLSKPTEFLEDILDSYISTDSKNIQDPNCTVTVDYRILVPCACEMEQINVINALLKTGNRYGQKRLLVHPLVESFLYLKWKALLPFFYAIIALYAFFVISLTTFIVSIFFYKDTHESKPIWLDTHIWSYIVYVSIVLIILQELLYMNVKSKRYFFQLETWIKFGSIILAALLPPAVTITSLSSLDWPRHMATLALLLSWLEMMFLLSRFPSWGYYVLMFGKVASNVIKILFTFVFLVIGFSLSFMIQFRSQIPFESPWAALVKTIVMMTSEFDYQSLFDEEHTENLATSLVVVRIIFLVFLILAAIVLMNLLVGVAVNDINDLEILGNIRRLAKQVEFLSTLDVLVYNKFFKKILPRRVNERIRHKRNVLNSISLCPGKPRWKYYKVLPSKLRDAILNKALTKRKQIDDEMGFQLIKQKIEEIHQAVVHEDKYISISSSSQVLEPPVKKKDNCEDIIKQLNTLDGGICTMKEEIMSGMQQAKSPIEEMNVKIDQMSIEIEEIKQYLNRLESKMGRL